MKIDLNCDMGEGCPNDAELMRYVSSVNIACGFHAGDRDTMRRTIELAIANNCAIGAHPGYRDRGNFGRVETNAGPKETYEIVTEQIGILDSIANEQRGRICHVKPHGALYNRSARDSETAAAIAEAVRDFRADLVLFGLSGSRSVAEAERIGLRTASEVFADRTYRPDGSLTPRSEPNALIENANEAVAQVVSMVDQGHVIATDGTKVKIQADTVCIHGDGEHALSFALIIHRELAEKGLTIAPVHD